MLKLMFVKKFEFQVQLRLWEIWCVLTLSYFFSPATPGEHVEKGSWHQKNFMYLITYILYVS